MARVGPERRGSTGAARPRLAPDGRLIGLAVATGLVALAAGAIVHGGAGRNPRPQRPSQRELVVGPARVAVPVAASPHSGGRLAAAAPSLLAARNAYRALNLHFGASHGLFNKYADTPRYAGAWAVAQAMEGAVDLGKLPAGGVSRQQIRRLFAALRFYWDPAARPPGYDKLVRPPLGPGGYKFYDDNALIGLSLVRAYEATGDPAMLTRAAQVFQFEKSGWDRRRSHAFPGGIFWKQSPDTHDRNTVSTAAAAELGLHLYLLSGQHSYLRWAERMYDWVNRTFRAPNGLYWDHVDLRGRISRQQWSYNQGFMLGCDELLYRATGRRRFLSGAQRIAARSLARYRRSGLDSQRPILDAIFFRNLLALGQLVPDRGYIRAAEAYARYLSHHVNADGLLQVNPRPFLLDQAALLQVSAYIALERLGLPIDSVMAGWPPLRWPTW